VWILFFSSKWAGWWLLLYKLEIKLLRWCNILRGRGTRGLDQNKILQKNRNFRLILLLTLSKCLYCGQASMQYEANKGRLVLGLSSVTVVNI